MLIKKEVMNRKLTIGVTGTGSLVGQAIIKCIKKSEYYKESTLIGFDYVDETVASFWVDTNYKLSDILNKNNSHKQIVSEVINIINTEKIDILFIGIDFDLPMYAEHKKEIESKTSAKVIVSSAEVIEIADSKWETFKFLELNGLNRPITYKVEGEIPESINYPAILKPSVGASSKGVSIVNNKLEVIEKAKLLNQPILQELIGDMNSEYTCGVVMLNGELIDMIVLRRTLKNGDTFKAWSRKDYPEQIYSYVEELARILKPHGACNFQLRLDNNGVPKLFEINARHSGTTHFRCLFGFNEVELILNQYYPVEGFQKKPLLEGMAMRYFEETLVEVNG